MLENYTYDHIASDYDRMCKQYKWHAPEIIFGLLYNHIKEGDKLLDIGIGTGICSERFYKAGIEIYGLDNSRALLSICQSKGISRNLVLCDLVNDEIPFADHSFGHMICGGVLHFFSDLSIIFAKTVEKLKAEGIFVFTIFENHLNDDPIHGEERNGTAVYLHSAGYIINLLAKFGLVEMTNIEFLTYKDLETKEQQLVKVLMTKKL